jgi:hypothetical protein
MFDWTLRTEQNLARRAYDDYTAMANKTRISKASDECGWNVVTGMSVKRLHPNWTGGGRHGPFGRLLARMLGLEKGMSTEAAALPQTRR